MYQTIWNHLPGSTAVKAVIFLVAILAVVWLLLEVVFPGIAPHLPGADATV